MIKKLIFFFVLLCANYFTVGQSKTVKMVFDSTKIYLRFFYKNYKSNQTINDSIKLICRKINEDTFYLDKFVNKKKQWTKIYRIELASDSLRVLGRVTDIKGKSKFIRTKEKYYNSFEIMRSN